MGKIIEKTTFIFMFCVSALYSQYKNQPETKKAVENQMFDFNEIINESTLEIKVLKDWHVDKIKGTTRQKLIEINVVEWWPGQDYRIPVRFIVPLKSKAKGFHITGGNKPGSLSKDINPSGFEAKLLLNGIGMVKTIVKPFREMDGKQSLQKEMMMRFMNGFNPKYSNVWIYSMTLMRATTAAYTEVDHFEKGKVAGSGASKNGVSPAIALINDKRFTATCSNVAFAYYSPTRRANKKGIDKVKAANKAFYVAAKAGNIKIKKQRAKWYQSVMVGGKGDMVQALLKAGMSQDEFERYADFFWSKTCVTENWEQLMKREADIFFQPGTHDWVAYDILFGAQNYPQLPVYYQPNGGHHQNPHSAAYKDNQNLEAFLWNHFFGGESLLKPPTSSYKVNKEKLSVTVSFNEGSQPKSGRIWWIYNRAPAGSAPFLHVQISEEQWMDMEFDEITGTWNANIPLKGGFERIDFFSNHGLKINGYKQYLSSPYTRVEGLNTIPN